MRPNDPMVSVEWLANNIDQSNILVVDATWSMPGNQDPHIGSYINGVGFDIDQIADTNSSFAHTLPSPEHFEREVRKLGVHSDTHIVCYDRHGLFSSPRVWWMFRVMGHEKVNVLDGGFPAWIAAGCTTTSDYRTPEKGDFKAQFQSALLKKTSDIHNALNRNQILDARPKGRFDGTAPEPRIGLSSGHMPGATSVPFSELKTSDGFLKNAVALRHIFDARQTDLNAPIVSTCGSGITACGIAISLARLGAWDVAVYDGSWTEWASTDGCPIEKVEQ